MSSRFDNLLEAYRQTTFEFGVADIFTDDSPDVAARTGSFVLLMNQAKTGKDGDHVHGVLVVAPPPDSKLGCDQAEIERASRKAAATLFNRELSEKEQASTGRFVRVVHARDFDIESAIQSLQTADERSAAVVLYAALYRMTAQQDIPSLPSIPMPDDLWVSHLCALAARAVAIAKLRNFYLLLDTGETAPQRPENSERLKSIDGCGLFGMYSKHDGGKLIANNIANWRSLAEAGRLGSAFASIDSLPDWMDSQKSFLKLQLMELVTPGEEILHILREDAHIRTKADYRARLKLARIAEHAHDDDLSLELLKSSIDELRSEEEYLLAVDLADDLAEFVLLERILDRADVLFPNSSRLFDLRLRMCLRLRRYGELVKRVLGSTVPIDPQRRFFFLTLGSVFASEGPVGFDLLLNTVASATPQFTSWCQAVCTNEAIERQDFLQSVHLCMPVEGRPLTKNIASVLIGALRLLLLQRGLDRKNLMIKGDDMVPPVQAVIGYLSNNPRDAATRQRLTSLLSVETSGLLGFAILVAITERLSTRTTLKTRPVPPPQPITPEDDDATLEVVKNIMDWAAKESPLVPGRTIVPQDLLTVPPDEVMSFVGNALKHGSDLRVKLEEETFDKIMAVGLIIAPLTTDPDDDLDLLRYAGARYIAANKAQKARDLAEQALNTAANTPIRKRLAWIAFSDIYHRAHSFNEALLGIACALSIDIPVDYEQLYQEGSLLVRIYRDIKFRSEAKRLADRLLVRCGELNLDKAYGQRIKTLLLHIRMIEVFGHPETLMEELPNLIQDAAQHCLELVEVGEETSPAVMILAQSIQRGIAAGVEVSETAKKVLGDRLASTPHPIVDMVKLMDNSATTGSELLAFAKSIQAARNAEDIAFDLMMLGIAMRRFLDSDIDDGNVSTAAFCLEALTDHAFKNALIGTERSPFQERERSLDMARDLSLRGIDILMVGLSEKGILVRLRVTEGIADLEKESSDVFSEPKFLAWSEKYPYGYAQVTEAMNLFYVTLTGIGISLVLTRPTLIVMDNSLQQMPPNLIMSGDNFAGRQVPMAAAPSLSWAWEMSARILSTTKKVAWISTEYADDKNPALIMVAERLDETLRTNEITLHTSADVPNDLAEAEIAIIAAHGSILPEGRYVQRISDDAELAFYPAVLANAVRGSAIVILFICSGGRFDTHPVAETTVGLVRELLDQGCSTVIASPWPLDTRVPSHWLPTFLDLGGMPAKPPYALRLPQIKTL